MFKNFYMKNNFLSDHKIYFKIYHVFRKNCSLNLSNTRLLIISFI